MIVKQIVVSPVFGENCFIAGCESTKEAVVIDPGDQPEIILKAIDSAGLNVKMIINTHAHIDHIGGVQKIRKEKNVKFFLHKLEAPFVEGYEQQCTFFGIRCGEKPQVDGFLEEGGEIKVGTLTGKIIFTPGHSPGGVCFDFGEHVFVGDTLFQGSIGRTDLPGGDYDTLIKNIKEKLLILPPETIVHCGHGPDTTIGNEKASNPFLTGRAMMW